jgi:LysR family nitrogen assimilation transcriptional regulator
MDLKQLRYFISVAETGSISKSAVVLCISQPVLSRHLAALEAEFGFSLLFRNGRGVLLTDAGEKLLTAARAVMEDIRVLEGEMLALRQVPIGEAVIGIPPMLGDYLSVPLVKAFRQRFPRVSLQLVEGLSGHIHEWLVTGKLDVAILYNAPNNSIIMAEALLKDDLCLLGAVSPPAAEEHSIRFADLAGLPLIMPSKPHGLRSIIENVANKLGVRLNIEMKIDAYHAMVDLAEAGLGYTILPFMAIKQRALAGRLRTWVIREPNVTGVLSVATSTQRPRTPATRHLLDSVKENVRLLVQQGVWISSPGDTGFEKKRLRGGR